MNMCGLSKTSPSVVDCLVRWVVTSCYDDVLTAGRITSPLIDVLLLISATDWLRNWFSPCAGRIIIMGAIQLSTDSNFLEVGIR